MHSDVLVDVVRRRRAGERRTLADRHLRRWRQGGVSAACLIIGGDAPSSCPLGVHRPLESVLHTLDAVCNEIAEAPDELVQITDAASCAAARAGGQFGILLGLEGAGPLGGDLGVFRSLFRMGLRHLGLTWNHRNAAGDGVGESDSRGGLTRFGRELVAEAMRLGVLVDASHLAEPGFWDLMKLSTRPPVATHVCARALHPHPRNLSDDQIRALADRGGIVGLALYPGFIGPGRVSVEDALRHLDHLVRVAGEDHVGLGPDFIDFAPEITALDLGELPFLYSNDQVYPTGVEDTTRLQAIVEGLRSRGYGETLIEKICWGNAVRVLRDALG